MVGDRAGIESGRLRSPVTWKKVQPMHVGCTRASVLGCCVEVGAELGGREPNQPGRGPDATHPSGREAHVGNIDPQHLAATGKPFAFNNRGTHDGPHALRRGLERRERVALSNQQCRGYLHRCANACDIIEAG